MEEFTLRRVGQIQQEQARLLERSGELRSAMKALQAADAALQQQLIRAQRFDPSQGVCPRCAIDDAITCRLLLVPGPNGSNVPAVPRCPQCGWTDSAHQSG